MDGFKEILPSEVKENFFTAINDDWMLISAMKADSSINTMTASWGGFGIMWSRPVCVCVIRPQRYTLEFVNENDRLTLSFLEDGYRDALKICGSKSGRDCDKISESGLTPLTENGIVGFKEARMIVCGKKIYRDVIKEDCFIDKSLIEQKYPDKDYHSVFVCEIEKIYVK